MAAFISILIIFLIFGIFVSIFFVIAVSDAKVREKNELHTLKSLPEDIELKAVVRYNIGRPQGRFLKMKSFQGSGVLYVQGEQLIFKDILGNEDHVYDLNTCKLSWVENKINGITNAFKVADHEAIIFFYIDKGVSIFSTIEENASTSDLYIRLKEFRKSIRNAKKVESANE
ncbi:hypothetical protein [Empedobacter stercoris]|jgi:hypothetical protein|uniref:hypothetical protein n=1 Tax=Empedobacter stercoris TaxID=1628248 RepID=UPI0039EB39E5